jgi:hypothetical protein
MYEMSHIRGNANSEGAAYNGIDRKVALHMQISVQITEERTTVPRAFKIGRQFNSPPRLGKVCFTHTPGPREVVATFIIASILQDLEVKVK